VSETESNGARPKVAFFDFSSCEGCQLTVVDALQTHLDLLEAVEIVQFREAMSERSDDYLIAFVEGSITRQKDEPRLKQIRERAKIVVALGACAHIGGVNTIRNRMNPVEVRRLVYGRNGNQVETAQARPLEDVIQVDAFIPGCPIDRGEFVAAVKALLQGRLPSIPQHPLCVECKLNENPCVCHQGGVCLGPITRAGCGAICPTYGSGCEGCRGLIPEPNLSSLNELLAEHGLAPEQARASLGLFLSHSLAALED
jgi:coenzyme F420-reducing hydrogenase gamma subunit